MRLWFGTTGLDGRWFDVDKCVLELYMYTLDRISHRSCLIYIYKEIFYLPGDLCQNYGKLLWLILRQKSRNNGSKSELNPASAWPFIVAAPKIFLALPSANSAMLEYPWSTCVYKPWRNAHIFRRCSSPATRWWNASSKNLPKRERILCKFSPGWAIAICMCDRMRRSPRETSQYHSLDRSVRSLLMCCSICGFSRMFRKTIVYNPACMLA